MPDATSEPCENCRALMRMRAALLGSGRVSGFCGHQCEGLLVVADVERQEVTAWSWQPASKAEVARTMLAELQVADATAEKDCGASVQ